MIMKKLIYWIIILECLINSIRCQATGSSDDIKGEFLIVGIIVFLLLTFIFVLCCFSKLHRVGHHHDVEAVQNDSVFVIESGLKDLPPKYCEVINELPPPSFESVFPDSLDTNSDVKTDHLKDLQLATPIDTICDKS